MKKAKKAQSSKKPRTMLDQEVGSMLDIKTNQDFNNEHPDHDKNGLLQGDSGKVDKKIKTKITKKSIKHTYHISGMNSAGSVTTVKNKLSAAPGVISVQVDLKKNQAEITSSQAIKAHELQKALGNTGYTIAELRV